MIDADRLSGNALLTVADNVTLNTGTADLTLSLLNGAGKTYSASGNLSLGNNVTLQTSGSGTITLTAQANGSDITLGSNSQLQTQNSTLELLAITGLEATAGSVTVQAAATGESIVIDTAMTLDATFLEQTLTAGTAALLQSTNDILFSSPLTSSGSGALTVNAGGNATLDANLNMGSGVLDVVATTGDVNIGSSITVQTSSSGTITLTAQANGSDITLGSNSQLQTQNSTLALSINTGLEATAGSVTVQAPANW